MPDGRRLGRLANPFAPGAGSMPRFLAGRDDAIVRFGRRLDFLAAGKCPSQGILLHGPRGTGKTVLLRRLAALTAARGCLAEELDADVFRGRESLVAELRERAGVSGGRRKGGQIGAVGATVERAERTAAVSRLLDSWISSSAPPALFVDEAQRIPAGPGFAFFSGVQRARRSGLPFVLVIAGTPGVRRALRQAGTFTERMFERLRVGRLSPADAAAALSRPAEAAGRRMDPDALSLLVPQSQNYPYFIQLLGSAAWDAAVAADEPRITAAAAKAGITASAAAVAGFYADRFAEAEEHGLGDLLPALARAMTEAGGRLGSRALGSLLRRDRRDWIPLRGRLEDLGVLWEVSPGQWEMGIPSFAGHILDRARGAHGAPHGEN